MITLLPAVLLALVALIVPSPGVSMALAAASLCCAFMALLGMLLLRLTSDGSVAKILAGVVGGMLMRLVAVAVFCLTIPLLDGVHVLAACLAVAGGLVAALIIDSTLVARRLCAHSSASAPEVASV